MTKNVSIRLSQESLKKLDDIAYMCFKLGKISRPQRSKLLKEYWLTKYDEIKIKYDESLLSENKGNGTI